MGRVMSGQAEKERRRDRRRDMGRVMSGQAEKDRRRDRRRDMSELCQADISIFLQRRIGGEICVTQSHSIFNSKKHYIDMMYVSRLR